MDKKKMKKAFRSVAGILTMIGVTMIVDGAVKTLVPGDKKWIGKLFLGAGVAAITDTILDITQPVVDDEIDTAFEMMDRLMPNMFAKNEVTDSE